MWAKLCWSPGTLSLFQFLFLNSGFGLTLERARTFQDKILVILSSFSSRVCTLPRRSVKTNTDRQIHIVLIEISYFLGSLTKPFCLLHETQMGAAIKLIDLTFCSFCFTQFVFFDHIDDYQLSQETVDSTREGDCLDFLQLLTFSRQDVCEIACLRLKYLLRVK